MEKGSVAISRPLLDWIRGDLHKERARERARERSRVVTVPPYGEERGGRSRVATSTPPRRAKQRSNT